MVNSRDYPSFGGHDAENTGPDLTRREMMMTAAATLAGLSSAVPAQAREVVERETLLDQRPYMQNSQLYSDILSIRDLALRAWYETEAIRVMNRVDAQNIRVVGTRFDENVLRYLNESKLTVHEPGAKYINELVSFEPNAVRYFSETLSPGQYGLHLDGRINRAYLVHKNQRGQMSVPYAYLVSVAAKGFGAETGSDKTPPGPHRIQHVNHEYQFGHIASTNPPNEEKFPRLRPGRPVRGLNRSAGEPAMITSFAFYIDTERGLAIHGSNRESTLGRSLSGGCARMSNFDVMHLSQFFGEGSPVWITGNQPYYNE